MAEKISLEKYFVGLSKDSLIYGLGNAVLRILALITAPIFTRIFIPEEYGIISLIASAISFLSLFLIFGMDSSIFISFYEYKKERKQIISSAFWFLFFWGVFLMSLSSLLSGNLSSLIFKTDIYKILFLLSFSTAFFTLLINVAKIVFRLEFKAKIFALVAALNALITTGLMIYFVVFLRKGLLGYFEGQLIGTFITAIYAVYLIRKNLQFKIDFPKLKEMVLFGSMIVPTSLSFFVFDLSDRFFIYHYRNLTELGLYSIGINIASLIVFFSYALGQAWSPQVMKLYFETKKIFFKFVPRFFIYYLIFFFILATVISFFGKEILIVFTTPKYYDAAKVIGPLSLAMVFSASNQVTSLGINISRKTKYFAFYTSLAAVLNIILNFILIPKYGMVGASWATAIAYLFLTCAYFYKGQRLIHLDIDWKKFIRLIILSVGVIVFSSLLWRYGFWQNFLIKIIEFVVFLLLLYYFEIIEKQELQYLKIYLKRFFLLRPWRKLK